MKPGKDMIEFDLSETLYFESGQEIEEMLSISLDPDIAIQPYDSYVQIRGLIILQGEYRKRKQDVMDKDNNHYDHTKEYVEKVIETAPNQAKFSHRFPVEISVPVERVENLKDITVSVDTFDYELPDKSKLVLIASIHIHGIKSERKEPEKKEEDISYSKTVESTKNMDETSIDQQTEKETTEVAETMEVKDTEKTLPDSQPELEQQRTEDLPVTKEVQQSDEEVQQSEFEEAVNIPSTSEEEVMGDELAVQQLENDSDANVIDIQLSESEVDEDESEIKDVQFLTELFGGESEETYAQMRIYITQEDDTIDSVAKRYEISTLQLMKDNQLTGDGLTEGQLLRVPVKVKE